MNEIPICPECQREARLVDSKIVYGTSYGQIWYCDCIKGAVYVGCHEGTIKPFGTMANAKLRYYRKRAHQYFDPLWKNKSAKMTRTEAYAWLSLVLGIPEEKCHIGLFDEEQCKEVERVARNKRGLDMKIPKR